MSHIRLRGLIHSILFSGALAFANTASAALIFDFSFFNEDGTVAGEVAGTIELPGADGIFAATDLRIVTAPAALGYPLPISIGDFESITENTFSVAGGVIDSASSRFFGIFPGFNTAFALNGTDFDAEGRSFLDASTGGFLGDPGTFDADSSSLTYSSVSSVPVPPSVGLLALGLIAPRLRFRG